jgi:hypothetical protein
MTNRINDTADILATAAQNLADIQVALTLPSANDLIYWVPNCLAIRDEDGKVNACGARFATPLPAGRSYKNGAGTPAVRTARRVVLQNEMDANIALIKMMAEHLKKAAE